METYASIKKVEKRPGTRQDGILEGLEFTSSHEKHQNHNCLTTADKKKRLTTKNDIRHPKTKKPQQDDRRGGLPT